MPVLINYSKQFEGKENYFIHEFDENGRLLVLMVSCSVTDLPGSMIKSFITEYAKEHILSNPEFNPSIMFEFLIQKSQEIAKNHFYDDIRVGISLFYRQPDQPACGLEDAAEARPPGRIGAKRGRSPAGTRRRCVTI